jgi:arabinan endo-1,5-alpha-L-arabinosidase
MPGGATTVPPVGPDEGSPEVTMVAPMMPMTPGTLPPPDPPPMTEPDPVVMPENCEVGVADPNDPPQALALSGSLGAHDPVIIAAHDQFYYFSTGNGISAKVSTDLLSWQQQPSVFPNTPAWFQQLVPAYQPQNIWAPDISYFGGQYHLYYSVSSFGSNRSCIGHATRAALNEGAWTDHEDVFCTNQPRTRTTTRSIRT